jgi:energy-coupling factor transporter ATP-binding protein EcfA2
MVLDRVSFAVSRSGTGVLLGRADAGKTTLSRVVSGLVPRFTGGAVHGSVASGGRELRGVPPYDLLTDVGLVAQDSEEQLLTTRCDTEVAFALESLGQPRAEMRRRVSESLQRVGLAGFEARNPATLSGGEKKRLLAACLDAVRPGVWILDEALGELDFEWKLRVLDLIAEREGTVLVMESRWTPLAERRGTSFFLLAEGRIRASAADSSGPEWKDALRSSGISPVPGRPPAPAARDGYLRAEKLKFRFEGTPGFSLEMESLQLGFGDTCALVGRNGSGKSTLGKILCGLIRAQSGRIVIAAEQSSHEAGPGELNGRVGYLFQNPDHQIFLPTVREELALGLRGQRLDPGELEKRVRSAAESFGLVDLEAPPALLSYGARRRLQAAAYSLLSRDLLILDEIDSGLSYGEIQSLLETLSSRTPGLVLITHDLFLARTACRRVILMDQGRIAEDIPSGSLEPSWEMNGRVPG